MAWGISWFLGNGMGSMIQCEMSWIAHSHSGMAEASEERALGGRQGGTDARSASERQTE